MSHWFVPFASLASKSDHKEYQMVLYVQNDRNIQQASDQKVELRCAPQETLLTGVVRSRANNPVGQTSKFSGKSLYEGSVLQVQRMLSHNFSLGHISEAVECRMDVMKGRIPFLKPIDGFVDLGQDVTVMIKIRQIGNTFHIHCIQFVIVFFVNKYFAWLVFRGNRLNDLEMLCTRRLSSHQTGAYEQWRVITWNSVITLLSSQTWFRLTNDTNQTDSEPELTDFPSLPDSSSSMPRTTPSPRHKSLPLHRLSVPTSARLCSSVAHISDPTSRMSLTESHWNILFVNHL